ncbi:MAG: hypothetical protein D6748_14930 [Calditrichaeota bacterium]|nr:MAG: hypothetical protein D6748_14930 [Calditrichota bacterium]
MWSPLPAQEVPLSKILLDIPPDTVYFSQDSLLKTAQLPHHFLIPGSDRVYLKTFQLKNHLHYTIDYQKGQIHLLRAYPGVDTVKIVYRKYPFPLINNYFHQKLAAIADDDSLGDNISARAVQPKFLQEIDSYQSRLQKSGSIVRGIEIGSNQDLSLNSGLNLQLSGKITPDVEVVAALTDESTPIQPEGNTQNLREVDKVFVKLKSPYMGGTLGDFNIQYQQSLFGNLQRKLQGITLENQLKQTHQQLTYGTSRGFFHTNRFLGQEGNQGPYQLTGKNGEREIIVLAGTERVYVDGVLQIRGENNDYIIDYSQAQITFTNKKLITSENRIEVDFEYTRSIQRYGRTFVGFSSYTPRAGNRFYYDVRLFREWDDTNNLLEDNAPLTTGERFALQTAGDDPLKAFVSGAQMVEEGSGTYVQDDTLLSDGNIYPYYRYVGPGKGNYLVRFTGVGKQRGDYIRQRLGVFKYVGPGKGEYLPIKLVPLAADKRMANVGVGMKVTNNWNVQGELALSQFDQNVFSAVDDADNEGMAFQFSTSLQDSSFKIAGIRAGKLSFQARWTRQDSSFSPLDRPLQPEYAYKWNFAQQQLTNEENSLESNLMYSPFRALRLMGSFGTLKKGRGVSSTRQMGEIRISRTRFPGIRVRREQVFSQTPLDESNWMRNSLEISHKIWKLHPQYIFRKEDRTVETGMRKTGFLFQESKGIVDIKKLGGVNVQAQVQLREDYLYNPHSFGNTLKQANTSTYELQGEIESARKLSGRFSLAIRKKDYTDFFERLPADSMLIYQPDAQFQDTTWKDRKSNLANLELNYRNESGSITSRLDYQVSSELQALREKVYINVGETRGNFRFDSTLNEYVPDPLGNYILVLLQTGEFESVTNLESAWQFSYRPRLNRDLRGFWKKFLNRISNISYIKIEEQSRLDNVADIYLLNLNKFHKVATSLRSVYTINEDLYYNERNPDWGMLFRSRYRDVLSNLFLDEENNETRIIWERFIQLRKRFFKRRLNVTAEYKNTLNKRWVAAATSRNQNILSQSGLTRWTYRLNYRWQLELSMERGIEKDRFSQNLLQVNYWDIRPEIVYSLRGKARATANLQFLQVQEVSNPLNRPIPFDMGKGKKPGNSWLWNIRFEYFLSNNVIITANYTGRKDAGALKPIHLGKAEVRAFF